MKNTTSLFLTCIFTLFAATMVMTVSGCKDESTPPAPIPPVNPPGNPPANQPGNPPANQPGNPPANQPGNPPANPPANQPGNPPANQPGNPPANQPGNPPANPPANQPGNPPANPPANQPGNPPANPPANQPGNPPANPPAVPATAANVWDSIKGVDLSIANRGPVDAHVSQALGRIWALNNPAQESTLVQSLLQFKGEGVNDGLGLLQMIFRNPLTVASKGWFLDLFKRVDPLYRPFFLLATGRAPAVDANRPTIADFFVARPKAADGTPGGDAPNTFKDIANEIVKVNFADLSVPVQWIWHSLNSNFAGFRDTRNWADIDGARALMGRIGNLPMASAANPVRGQLTLGLCGVGGYLPNDQTVGRSPITDTAGLIQYLATLPITRDVYAFYKACVEDQPGANDIAKQNNRRDLLNQHHGNATEPALLSLTDDNIFVTPKVFADGARLAVRNSDAAGRTNDDVPSRTALLRLFVDNNALTAIIGAYYKPDRMYPFFKSFADPALGGKANFEDFVPMFRALADVSARYRLAEFAGDDKDLAGISNKIMSANRDAVSDADKQSFRSMMFSQAIWQDLSKTVRMKDPASIVVGFGSTEKLYETFAAGFGGEPLVYFDRLMRNRASYGLRFDQNTRFEYLYNPAHKGNLMWLMMVNIRKDLTDTGNFSAGLNGVTRTEALIKTVARAVKDKINDATKWQQMLDAPSETPRADSAIKETETVLKLVYTNSRLTPPADFTVEAKRLLYYQ